MAVFILETFSITKSQEEENMCGQMAKPMREHGRKIKCMVMVY